MVRGLALACLGASLADPRLPASGPAAPPVAVVDVSESIGGGPLAPPPDARVASRWVAVGATVREVEGRAAAPGISRAETRLAEALRWASAAHPGRDLWVFTDGRATDGDPAEAARAVAAAGGRVFVSAPAQPAADVALVEARAVPRADGTTLVGAVVAASTSGTARLLLSREGRAIDEAVVALAPGARRVIRLRDDRPPPTGATYALRLEPGRGTPDDDPENDRLAFGVPPTRPSVVVWGDLAVGDWSAPERPFQLRQMAAFEAGALDVADCVVMTSLPWRRIGDRRVRALTSFVAGGGRLLVLGGPASWAVGGWSGTTLEDDLLPLRVPRPEGTELALVIALDRSGSTKGARPHLARAVREAARDLKPGERVAVLPFAAAPASDPLEPGWLDAESGPEARDVFERALDRLVPSGGTDLPSAIQAAARLAAGVPARSRRVVLLTDGDPDNAPDPTALAQARRDLDRLGVDFGALVTGMPEAARRLRAYVARTVDDVVLFEGSNHFPERLRRVLAKGRADGERLPAPTSLRWTGSAGAVDLASLAPTRLQAVEPVPGHGAVLAEALLPEGRRAPFLGRRAVGAGAVLALAWGPEWEADPQSAGRRLTGLVGRLAREADRGLAADERDGRLVLRAREAKGAGGLAVSATPASAAASATLVTRLLEVEPGLFQGPAFPEPVAAARVRLGDVERPLRLPARPAAEHRGAGVDEMALRRMAAAGGGARLASGARPPAGPRGPGPPLTPWLLLVGAMLLVLDRALTEGGASGIRSPGEGGTPA